MPNEPGLVPLSDAPSLEGLNEEERVDAMVSWFFANFEDPAQETPYNGREGGFLYIHGGPYEAADYIAETFPDAADDDRNEAIDRINSEGPEFAPAGHRILPPDEAYDDLYSPPPLSVRLDALGGQLDEIRAHVTAMLDLQRSQESEISRPPPAGHNNPPPDDVPDLVEMLESVGEVERELAKPNRQTEADPDVVVRAEGRFSRFLKWVKELAKESPTLLAKGVITSAGGLALTYAVNHHTQLLDLLQTTTGTLADWASALAAMF
jgi:hypothetical protein